MAVKPVVSKNVRIRHPEKFHAGEGSIVDDFCYFSTQVSIGRFSHVANGCSIAGGADRKFSLGDYSSLSAGVKIWCASDDFVNGLITLVPAGFPDIKEGFIVGDVIIGNYTGVGSNSVVMPGNNLPDGTAIGALSFVPPNYAFEPWMVYAGAPIRPIRKRNRDAVMRQVARFEKALEEHRERLEKP